jgi:hypothetical protein
MFSIVRELRASLIERVTFGREAPAGESEVVAVPLGAVCSPPCDIMMVLGRGSQRLGQIACERRLALEKVSQSLAKWIHFAAHNL